LEQVKQPTWQGLQLPLLSTHPAMQMEQVGLLPTTEQLVHAAPHVVLLFGALQVPLLRIWFTGQEVQI
jgi:hypothetical protein